MSELTCICPFCNEQIKCDSSQSGSIMECPACSRKLMVMEADSPTRSESKTPPAAQNAPQPAAPGSGIRTPPVATKPGASTTPPAAEPPRKQKKSPSKMAMAGAVAALLALAGAAGFWFLNGKPSTAPNADETLHLSFDKLRDGVIVNSGTGGSAMDGVIVGDVTLSAGKFGNALKLNGRGGLSPTDIVLVGDKGIKTDDNGSWTIAFWVKTTTSGAIILYQGDGSWNDGCTMVYLNNGDASAGGTRAGAVRYGGGWLTGTKTINDGRWHHVALVDDRGTETIFVDGASDLVASKMGHALDSNANQIWIGGSPDPSDAGVRMIGLIDEIWMFERPLSPAEVQSLMKYNSITQ